MVKPFYFYNDVFNFSFILSICSSAIRNYVIVRLTTCQDHICGRRTVRTQLLVYLLLANGDRPAVVDS